MFDNSFDLSCTPECDILERVHTALDATNGVHAERSAGVLTLRFDAGDVSTLDRHESIGQLWLSDDHLTWHFEYDPARRGWFDVNGKGGLVETLTRILSRRLDGLRVGGGEAPEDAERRGDGRADR